MPGKEELYDELSKFGTAASTHDDIVDALAILVNQFAAYADNSAHIESLGPHDYLNTGERAMHDRIFGNSVSTGRSEARTYERFEGRVS